MARNGNTKIFKKLKSLPAGFCVKAKRMSQHRISASRALFLLRFIKNRTEEEKAMKTKLISVQSPTPFDFPLSKLSLLDRYINIINLNILENRSELK